TILSGPTAALIPELPVSSFDYSSPSVSPHSLPTSSLFFFFNDPPTTEIYTLSLHDALPIASTGLLPALVAPGDLQQANGLRATRSEEHTSELQSQSNAVCRLLLEKKNLCPWSHGRTTLT